jgi:hypothetical protein
MSSLSLVQSCLLTMTRWVPLVQQKLLTFITSAALGAPIVSLFKDKIEQGWVNSCAVIKVRSYCCTRGTHRVTRWVPLMQQKLLTFIRAHEFTQTCSILSLNSDTMCAPSAAEITYLYHSTWVHTALFNLVFEQWHDGRPIASLFKDKIEQGWVNSYPVIKVRSFCCTRGAHRVIVQRQDWTRLSELMCCDKGKRFLLQ